MDNSLAFYGRSLKRYLCLPVMTLVLCFFAFPISKCFGDDAPLTTTGGLYLAYGFSFGYDECGEYVLGKRLREALIAKMDSCPFSNEAKLGFYKKTTSDISRGLSEMYHLLFTHPPAKFTPPEDAHCNDPHFQDAVTILDDKLSEYDAGKIALAAVVVNVKDKPGEAISCAELSKSGLVDSGSDKAGMPMTHGKGLSHN